MIAGTHRRVIALHGLARFGYLPSGTGLPVGFTSGTKDGEAWAGLTCAACHTREITIGTEPLRIDGGPSLGDFQAFLVALDAAVTATLRSDAAFDRFARGVVGHPPSPGEIATLRQRVEAWNTPFHAWIERGVASAPAWGRGRADAFGTIFNRTSGLGLGGAGHPVIATNIMPADAPVRYPFLWNAGRQEVTQWAGITPNWLPQLALIRNLGQAIGVFGGFQPVPHRGVLGVDWLNTSTVDFAALGAIESNLHDNLGPPAWPGKVDTALAARGAAIFARPGSCAGCHAVRSGRFGSWKTPVIDVCTDRRNHDVINRRVDTGVISGAYIPFYFTLQPHDFACNVLLLAAVGSDAQRKLSLLTETGRKEPSNMCAPPPTPPSYEARVLDGVWAAAPYLHNGSVRSLTELLMPSAERSQRFAVGPAYDLAKVGLAAHQPASATTMVTTGCSERDSGNSRCGHEGPAFGTTLAATDKAALIEYLKTLQTPTSSTPIPKQSTGLGCPA